MCCAQPDQMPSPLVRRLNVAPCSSLSPGPCGLTAYNQSQCIGDKRRLVRAVDLEGILGFDDELAGFLRLHSNQDDAQSHPRAGFDGRQKANLVQAVVEACGSIRRDDTNLHGEWCNERECQIAVRNGALKWALAFRSIDVDMDPLTIARAVCKLVDPRLIDRHPA